MLRSPQIRWQILFESILTAALQLSANLQPPDTLLPRQGREPNVCPTLLVVLLTQFYCMLAFLQEESPMVAKLVEDMLRPQSLPQGWTAMFDEAKGRRCAHRQWHTHRKHPAAAVKHVSTFK